MSSVSVPTTRSPRLTLDSLEVCRQSRTGSPGGPDAAEVIRGVAEHGDTVKGDVVIADVPRCPPRGVAPSLPVDCPAAQLVIGLGEGKVVHGGPLGPARPPVVGGGSALVGMPGRLLRLRQVAAGVQEIPDERRPETRSATSSIVRTITRVLVRSCDSRLDGDLITK
jgi:hypothetical protein